MHCALLFLFSEGEEHISVSLFDATLGPCFTVNMTSVTTHGSTAHGFYPVRGVTAILHTNEILEDLVRFQYVPKLKETHASGKNCVLSLTLESEIVLPWTVFLITQST